MQAQGAGCAAQNGIKGRCLDANEEQAGGVAGCMADTAMRQAESAQQYMRFKHVSS